MTSPTDHWSHQLYRRQNVPNRTLSGSIQFGTDPSLSDAMVVTTTINSPTTPTSHLSPEGRVRKPVRRRSRASNKTPTTLFNTDTSNFRAMVQKFTGGPSAIQQLNQQPDVNFPFGANLRQFDHINPNSDQLMVPANQLQRFQHQSQLQAYMLSLSNNNNTNTTTTTINPGLPGDNPFFQGLGNRTPSNSELPDEFAVAGINQNPSSEVHLPRPPGTSSSENRSNNFFF